MKRSLASAATAARATSGGGGLRLAVGLAPRPSEAAPTRLSLEFGEISSRMAIVAAFTFLAVRLGWHFMQTGRLTGLLLLASEALVVVLTVFRRPTGIVDRSVPARMLTTVSLIGPLLVGPAASAGLVPELATVILSAVGLLIVIGGKLSLGRSFGLMPANRGVVSTGLYRLVRHPIYLGYLVTHVGFLAANPTLWNLVTFVVADVTLMVRAVYEERVLARDASYRDYQHLVHWRVVPGVF
jgi:protein-S-isoprenylcysteine O-methyltransferase Ste14